MRRVIGVPDDKWGEAVKGLVIREKGSQVSEKELIDFCKNRLANYKKPKSIEFMEEFPKSTAGKVLKRELRKKYWKAGRKRFEPSFKTEYGKANLTGKSVRQPAEIIINIAFTARVFMGFVLSQIAKLHFTRVMLPAGGQCLCCLSQR